MNDILDVAGSYWWLVFPPSCVFAIWGRSWSDATERRHQRRMKLYRHRHPAALHGAHAQPGSPPSRRDGLIVLTDATMADLEERIAGALDQRRP